MLFAYPKNEQFNELLASIEETGKIKHRETKASCTFDFPEPNVKSIRESCWLFSN